MARKGRHRPRVFVVVARKDRPVVWLLPSIEDRTIDPPEETDKEEDPPEETDKEEDEPRPVLLDPVSAYRRPFLCRGFCDGARPPGC